MEEQDISARFFEMRNPLLHAASKMNLTRLCSNRMNKEKRKMKTHKKVRNIEGCPNEINLKKPKRQKDEEGTSSKNQNTIRETEINHCPYY